MTAKKKTNGTAVAINTKARIKQRVDRPKGVEDFLDPLSGELLNPKQEMFAHTWVQTFDYAEALKAGGYKKPKTSKAKSNQARSILRRPEVMVRVRSILKERVKHLAVTESFIVLRMIDLYEKAISEKPIVNNEGEVVGYDYVDLKVAQSTLKDLGANLGMFQNKNDKIMPTVVINMNYGDDSKAIHPKEVIQGISTRLN